MTRAGEQRLLDALVDAPSGTLTAAELAERLQVSTRSVRTYVVAARRALGDVVATTRDGYRLDVDAYWAARSAQRATDRDAARAPATPSERLAWLVRTIITATAPCSIHDLADALHVSDSTIESDLVKARAILAEHDVRLVRSRADVSAQGAELALRRAVRRLLVDDVAARTQAIDVDDLATAWGGEAVRSLRDRIHAVLEQAGLGVNAASTDVLVTHIAVMADRVRQGHTVVGVPDVRESPSLELARERLSKVVEELFDVHLPDPEVHYLGFLLAENALPDRLSDGDDDGAPFVDDRYVALVRTIVDRVRDVYDIDLSGDRFVGFLAMHVQHLDARARSRTSSTVPEGLSIRDTHPLVYEIAVFVAQQLQHALDIAVVQEEIALLSFHVGARFQGLHERDRRVSVAVHVPRYYDVHRALSRAVDDAIDGIGKVDVVVTDPTTDWARVDVDAVVSTVPLDAAGLAVLRVGVIPTVAELDALSDAVRGIARRKLRSRVATELVDMFDPALFSRGDAGVGSDALLGILADRLAASGYVVDGFVDDVRERERMSPTSFSSGAAIPHALTTDAVRPGIAVHVCDEPIDWAGEQVRLVAMFAFTRAQRETMGPLFEGFIHALVSADNVRTLVDEGTSYEGFIQGLLRVL
ncbi:BglG family transcription antiterminator [Agrococcus jejuensis]|uniref:Transcriptional antiterminator, BglG family n=1 Tax=Agrococcus jejuensis TaxID=399736 RepID=A0A1G8GZ15_9MICO|nr:PTS sugar transporter subunit IIA [Agrococcus jejuensis]SDH99551.1 transcriptional antiterminator, BglG family [Agrococcus jejuensis]